MTPNGTHCNQWLSPEPPLESWVLLTAGNVSSHHSQQCLLLSRSQDSLLLWTCMSLTHPDACLTRLPHSQFPGGATLSVTYVMVTLSCIVHNLHHCTWRSRCCSVLPQGSVLARSLFLGVGVLVDCLNFSPLLPTIYQLFEEGQSSIYVPGTQKRGWNNGDLSSTLFSL